MKAEYSKRFKDNTDKYEKLGINISQALELLLKENNIPYLSITYRVKNHDSFMEKIERKKYNNPFEEIEDICGVRIICYYQSDIERIKKVIIQEFEITNNENKEEKLDYDQFGYRSSHFIIKIKKEWFNTPNYRGLNDLKAELQVRTILMHAWAEIEHKLAYKSESQIPQEFRRKFSRISAKLEESDEQFEEIKNQIESKKHKLIESAKLSNQFDETEFNLDTLQAFLDYAFPERKKSLSYSSELFNEMVANNISLKLLAAGFEKTKDILTELEEEEIKTLYPQDTKTKNVWSQVGAARSVLELTNKNYLKMREDFPYVNIIKKYIKKLD